MTGRERLRTALAHQEADHVPFDLGACGATGILWQAYGHLRKYLGLPERPIRIWHTMGQLADPDEDLLQCLAADVRRLQLNPHGGWDLNIVEHDDGRSYVDAFGIRFHMPEGSLYFDPRGHPLKDMDTVQAIERYPWPDPTDPANSPGLAEAARQLRESTGAAVAMGSFWVGPLEGMTWLRGFEQSMMDLALNPKLTQAIMEKIVELAIAYYNKVLPQVRDWVDVIGVSDDLGGQQGPLISLEMYRKYMKPLHTRLFSTIKQHTDAAIFFHSCGSVWDFLPDLIESGIDILNPVQVGAAKMDTKALKREFGRDLVFWGGGCDTQEILPRGTPEQVRDEVKRRIDDLAPGGGFVFNPVHNIQAGVPPENIMAMWDAWSEYGVYT